MNHLLKKSIPLVVLILILGGCAGPIVKHPGGQDGKTSDVKGASASGAPSDSELFEEALSYLSNGEKEPNYNEARSRLAKLVEQHPKSKWAQGAQALIAGLDKVSALQLKLKQEQKKVQGEQAKLAREIEGLKDSSRQVDEKYAAEIARLQQENEQLKNDIQQLKKLEVQLEKREKMLR